MQQSCIRLGSKVFCSLTFRVVVITPKKEEILLICTSHMLRFKQKRHKPWGHYGNSKQNFQILCWDWVSPPQPFEREARTWNLCLNEYIGHHSVCQHTGSVQTLILLREQLLSQWLPQPRDPLLIPYSLPHSALGGKLNEPSLGSKEVQINVWYPHQPQPILQSWV